MASYAYSKQWKGKDGQDYFLWSGADKLKPYYGEPVYSYNQVMDMLKAARHGLNYGDDGDEKLYKAIYKKLFHVREKLDRVGISYDEPLYTESQVSGLKRPILMALGRDGSNNGRSEAELIQTMANGFGLPIMTKDEWTAYTRPDKVTQFMKYALPAAGLALVTAGIGGVLGGVDAAGNAVAGSLWSPTGATVGGGVTTSGTTTGAGLGLKEGGGLGLKEGGGLGLQTGSTIGPTFSAESLPEFAMMGGGPAAEAAKETASVFGKVGDLAKDALPFLGPLGDAVVGAINYRNNKDAYNRVAEVQKEYLDKMIDVNQGSKDMIQNLYNQARGDLVPYAYGGMGGLDALKNYYGNSAEIWGALGNLAGVNGREGQQAAISMIESSPAFEAMVKQGENAILQNASATGGLRGGNTQYALAQFRPQILAQLMDKQYQQLYGMAGIGSSAANSAAGTGANAAGNMANLAGRFGDSMVNLDSNLMNIYGRMAEAESNRLMNQAQNRAERNKGYGNAIGGALSLLGKFL